LKKSKVLVVGWDSADWKIIDKLMANGLMPAIKSIVDNGVRGKLATIDPPLSPMLWTSMATGVRPFDHGVLGFVEPDGQGGVRPVSSYSRKVKAIWNMLSIEGYKSNVVGWWPSNPVESINGCMISNLFHQEKVGKEIVEIADWKIPDGSVYPERIIDKVKDLRVHPFEITGNLIMPFVPQAVALDKKQDKRLNVIAKLLAHATTVHATATELMTSEPWDFMAVYHDAMDHFSHAFMKYHPPQMKGITDEAFNLFKDVVIGAYIYHDMMLDRMLKLVDEDTTVMVISDHGFHSDHLRPTHVPQVPSGPAIEHAPYGIIAIKGPGIKKGESIYGSSILDITPTLLSLYNLPIGRDMVGKPLVDIYEKEREIKYIDSWENRKESGGEIVIPKEQDTDLNDTALQQLIDLGYIDDLNAPHQDAENYLKGIINENNFYLAKSYATAGKYEEALEILLEIENKEKPDFRILIEAINCAVKTKRFKLAEEYLAFVRKNKLMNAGYIDVLESKVQLGLNRPDNAYKLLQSALKENPDAIEILLDMGRLLNNMRDSIGAIQSFERIIKKDPENPYAYHGIGMAYLQQGEYEDAISYFLDAIDRLYHYPLAHFHLGEAFALMKMYEPAIKSFEVVETMTQNIPKVYRWLLDLYEITENQEKSEHYRKLVGYFSRGQRKIITGLATEKLEKYIKDICKQGSSVGGYDAHLYDITYNVTHADWLDEIDSDYVFVPLNYLPSLNGFNSYQIYFVDGSDEEAMSYSHKINRIRANSIDLSLLEDLANQTTVANSWISQQPNIDLIRI
jgi:predicted AlkP superfamily phosphohydrolase/phosphomutase/tetratricopeptide (TPR) repeat protein